MAKKLNKSSLLWFIRSRPYTTVAELRRRFTLESEDVFPIKLPPGAVYVGLPEKPAGLLAQLVAEGRVGVELSTEVHAPIVDGVFPMDLREFRERIAAERGSRNGEHGAHGEHHEDEHDGDMDDDG